MNKNMIMMLDKLLMQICDIKNLYSIIQAGPSPTLIMFALANILTLCLHLMVPQDQMLKKLGLSIGIIFTAYALSIDQTNPQTCQLLLSFITVKIIAMGLSSLLKNKIGDLLFLVSFLFMNGFGLYQAIVNQYYKELFSQNAFEMLFLVGSGFCGVWVSDKILQQKLGVSAGSRRKIFHIIPLGLLPKLYSINCGYFKLMVIGSFYLFFQLEIFRFFILPKISDSPPLIKWMEELNSGRQPNMWFTHLNLILGLGITYIYLQDHYVHMSVILALADAMAALIGRKYGKTNIYGNKTFEGLFAFVSTVLLMNLLLITYAYTIDYTFLIIFSILCGLVEVYSGDIDNIALPLAFVLIYKMYYQ